VGHEPRCSPGCGGGPAGGDGGACGGGGGEYWGGGGGGAGRADDSCEGDPGEDGCDVDDVERVAAPITSLATDLPAAATPESTPIALFNSPIVSAMVLAETRPARRLSSTPSVKRWKRFGDCAVLSAYFDSRNST
jgi:hypothetical protein